MGLTRTSFTTRNKDATNGAFRASRRTERSDATYFGLLALRAERNIRNKVRYERSKGLYYNDPLGPGHGMYIPDIPWDWQIYIIYHPNVGKYAAMHGVFGSYNMYIDKAGASLIATCTLDLFEARLGLCTSSA